MNYWIRRRLKKRSLEVRAYINSIAPSVSYKINLITRWSYSLVFEYGAATICISESTTKTHIRVGSEPYVLMPDHGTDEFWTNIKSYISYYSLSYSDEE